MSLTTELKFNVGVWWPWFKTCKAFYKSCSLFRVGLKRLLNGVKENIKPWQPTGSVEKFKKVVCR